MGYRIIGDSCLELTEEMKKDSRFQIVPLTLQVDDQIIIDDDTFDQQAFLKMVKESKNCPRSACPSPEAFKKACECEEEDVFIITISSHLSGSYNSARVGMDMYVEEHGKKNILVIDSESASAGETNLALAICDMYEKGMDFGQVSEAILKMRDSMKTYFVLDTLELLRKNGRMTGLQAFFATALNIKPVMGADHGVIVKLDQTRGLAKAYAKMSDYAVKEAKQPETAYAVIAHCNCPGRAEKLRTELEKRAAFSGITVTQTAGVATLYAADGGVVLAVG